MEPERIVVDTNVIVAAMVRREGVNRGVMKACLNGELQPLIGQTLFLEYEDVLGRDALFRKCPLTAAERGQLIDAFLGCCEWTEVFYLWRPDLADESDNRVVELAVAGGAGAIVTHNVRDFQGAGLRFPRIRIMTPAQALKELL